jgi:hypothetical protein
MSEQLVSKPEIGMTIGFTSKGQQIVASAEFQQYLDEIQQKINAFLLGDALLTNTYTVATVPNASEWTQGLIYVSDETGGAIPAFSDGTNWRRVTDRNIVS